MNGSHPVTSNVLAVRRPLADTIVELASGAWGLADAVTRATRMELSVPIELRWATGGDDLIGDLPLFRRVTAFDAPTARLTITLTEVSV